MKECFRLQIDKKTCDFERLDRLRAKMQTRQACICSQRACIYTRVFKEYHNDPYILKKAKAFATTLREMDIYIEEDSLLFGNMASRNFAAPIYPEYSIDWVVEELDEFEKRRGDVFYIDEKVKRDIKEIAPFWHGHTHEDEVRQHLSKENYLAEQQGVLHRGGISMSGDGHIVPNHEMVLKKGFKGILLEAQAYLKTCVDPDKVAFYKAVIICTQASLDFIKRYGKLAMRLSVQCNGVRRSEYERMASMCKTLLEGSVEHFYEALESVYLIHILQMIESNGHSFCYGRFDQYMYPYYEKDVREGILDDGHALELLTHMFLMNSSCNKVRPYAHTKYSQGYPLYSNLMIGGYTPQGNDGTNALSYLCIEAMHQCSMAEPNFSMRYNLDTPYELLYDASQLIGTGCGMPSLFNDEVVVKAMESLHIPHQDALDYCAIGCVETGIQGKYGHRATGMTYVNWGKLLELLVNNGVDPKSGIQLCSLNGQAGSDIYFDTYEDAWKGWKTLLKFYTDLAVKCDHVCDASLVNYDADPFASSMIDNAMEKGKTLKAGGAKYDFVSQSNIGSSVVGNGLAVLKKLVFEEEKCTLEQLKEAMANNWEGKQHTMLHHMVNKVAKFGNDEDYVDNIVRDVFESYLELLPNYKTNCCDQGPLLSGYTMSTSNITSYVPNGLDVGATLDGRYAHSPLNEGCSPTQGSDTHGPTALINSVSKLPNEKIAAGQLLNMRFSKESLQGNHQLVFVNFLQACLHKNIFHNQFNIIDSNTLRKAQLHPEQYQDVIVRVAGYCAQFVSLMSEAQDAIIARSEHKL